MTDVSVIGMGSMGSALARTLLQSGYAVTVWNRSVDKAELLVSDGAEVADSASVASARPSYMASDSHSSRTPGILKKTRCATPYGKRPSRLYILPIRMNMSYAGRP